MCKTHKCYLCEAITIDAVPLCTKCKLMNNKPEEDMTDDTTVLPHEPVGEYPERNWKDMQAGAETCKHDLRTPEGRAALRKEDECGCNMDGVCEVHNKNAGKVIGPRHPAHVHHHKFRPTGEVLANTMKAQKEYFDNVTKAGPGYNDNDKLTLRDNAGKLQWSYLFEISFAIKAVIGVLMFGAKKYARGNWKKGGPNASQTSLMDSTMRHLEARARGERVDPESGEFHLAHAICNLCFFMYHHDGGDKE